MEIEWTDDQPGLRHIKEHMLESKLVDDLFLLMQKHELKEVEADKVITSYGCTNTYNCFISAGVNREAYLIIIQQNGEKGAPNITGAVGKIQL
ncbi:hypothetical protein J4225_04485 [Candidatus Pacearchaeota archaeon]|nr:hypothetical protein [Candidatus Pacearchaeota archaeon]